MKATCPHCGTVFRVDLRKVPTAGARARCSVCQGVFRVATPDSVSPRAPEAAPVPAPAPQPSPTRGAPAPTPVSASAPLPSGTAPVFGAADPQSRARRLARALVSDMVTYHPERRDGALSTGKLKQEFRDEIRKSWEEYVAQVGEQTAHGTSYFRDALNEILARGQPIF